VGAHNVKCRIVLQASNACANLIQKMSYFTSLLSPNIRELQVSKPALTSNSIVDLMAACTDYARNNYVEQFTKGSAVF